MDYVLQDSVAYKRLEFVRAIHESPLRKIGIDSCISQNVTTTDNKLGLEVYYEGNKWRVVLATDTTLLVRL